MRHPRPLALVLSVVALLLAGCGEGSEDPTVPPQGEAVDADEPPEDLRDVTDLAIEEAVEERGIPEADIEVVRAEEVEWPDAALGCPQEDETYTQAIVPGYLVVLEIGGDEVHYHAAEGEPPFHCESPQAPAGE